MEIQPIESQEDRSRAKEIDKGTLPIQMQNVYLGMPEKPGIQFDDRSSVNSTKWAFEQLVSQKQLLCTFQVDNENPSASKPYFILANNWRNIVNIHFRNLKDLFFVKSWKWHLTFQFRSNFQEVGMASIVYANIPMSAVPYITGSPIEYVDDIVSYYKTPGKIGIPATIANTAHPLFTLEVANQLPHTHVMFGENQDIQCTMNWLSPFKAGFNDQVYGPADFNDSIVNPNDPGYDMGFIYLFTPVPLTTGTGINKNLTVRVWSHLTDVEYSGYVPTDSII